MPQFKTFPGDMTEELALEVNRLIAAALKNLEIEKIPSACDNYFSQFNEDIKFLNRLLQVPPSMDSVDMSAYQKQEEFNDMYALGHKRWVQTGSNLSVAENVIKQAAQKANEYKDALITNHKFKARRDKIITYLSPQEWKPLIKMAKTLNCVEALLNLKADWCEQKEFAYYNSEDLIVTLKELKNFNLFLKFIKSSLSNQVNSIILSTVNDNIELVALAQKNITVAMAWRLHAASLYGDLWFDDPLWALNKRLKELLGEHYQENDAYVLSESLTPLIAKTFIKHLQKAPHKIDRDKWFSSRWVLDFEKQYPIAVVVTEDLEIIPKALASLVPAQAGFPDKVVSYFYFRGHVPTHKLGAYLKKTFLGSPYLIIPFLNEVTFQVNLFTERWMKQNDIVLCEITDTSAFKNSLLFPKIIAQEKAKIHFFCPQHLMVRALTWLPRKIFQNETQHFLEKWALIIEGVEKNIMSKNAKVATRLVLGLEKHLVHEIKTKFFKFPKNLIWDLSRFVEYYGTDLEKARFRQVISPAYLFKQFNFMSASNTLRQLDEGAVFIFLRYAQLYWSAKESEAAHTIANLLGGIFPKNEIEDEQLLTRLSAWFADRAQIKAFLDDLGINFIAQIGSRANPLAYRFLKQYSVEGLRLWEQERDRDLYRKYSVLINVLEQPVGNEIDLYRQGRAQELDFVGDLRRGQSSSDYIAALKEILNQYLKNYTGSNGSYAELIFHLCHDSPQESNALKFYFTRRIQYLVSHPESKGLEAQELSLYHSAYLSLSKIVEKNIFSKEVESFKTFNLNIHAILDSEHYLELLGRYHFERIRYLLEMGDFETIYEESGFVDTNNALFNIKINEFFIGYFKTHAFGAVAPRLPLDWVIEYYGNLKVKQENRYLAIQNFYETTDKSNVEDFVEGLKLFLGNHQLHELFPCEQYKKQLGVLYTRFYAKRDGKNGKWDPFVQHFLQNVSYSQIHFCLLIERSAWLNQFLFFRCPTQLSGLPLTMHLKNLEPPNEDMSLSIFYGEKFLKAKAIVFRYMNQEPTEIHDRKIKLLARYLEDDLFRKDANCQEMRFKIERLNLASDIINHFKQDEWEQAKACLIRFKMEAKPLYFLLSHTTNKNEIQTEIKYYDCLFKTLEKRLQGLATLKTIDSTKEREGVMALFQTPLYPQSTVVGPKLIQRKRSLTLGSAPSFLERILALLKRITQGIASLFYKIVHRFKKADPLNPQFYDKQEEEGVISQNNMHLESSNAPLLFARTSSSANLASELQTETFYVEQSKKLGIKG